MGRSVHLAWTIRTTPDSEGCCPQSHAFELAGSPDGYERCPVLEAGRVEGSEVRGTDSEGAKRQESIGRPTGATRGRRERTRSGSKAPKSVKRAERDGSVDHGLGRPGSGLRAREKGTHSQQGNEATALFGVWASGKLQVTRLRSARHSTPVDNGQGERGLERGPRLATRGRL